MKNFVIKGIVNWYYLEGVYESFIKDFEIVLGKFNIIRFFFVKFECDFF